MQFLNPDLQFLNKFRSGWLQRRMAQFRLELCHYNVLTFWPGVLESKVSVSKLRNLGSRVKITYKEISHDPGNL